jgi:hypothetical protein
MPLLALAVQQQLRRQQLEALLHADGGVGAHNASHSGRSFSSSYTTIADDDLLPLLAETAAHPELTAAPHAAKQQHHSQQQQQSGELVAGAAAAAGLEGSEVVRGGIPRSIIVLSMVSMALTSASCVFNTLLPIYMVTELKLTMRTMGMFEGE